MSSGIARYSATTSGGTSTVRNPKRWSTKTFRNADLMKTCYAFHCKLPTLPSPAIAGSLAAYTSSIPAARSGREVMHSSQNLLKRILCHRGFWLIGDHKRYTRFNLESDRVRRPCAPSDSTCRSLADTLFQNPWWCWS